MAILRRILLRFYLLHEDRIRRSRARRRGGYLCQHRAQVNGTLILSNYTPVYSLLGLTLATMCIDVAGFHYLERLHQWGRRMTTADYLKLMKEAKLRRKRKEVGNRLEAQSKTTRAGNEKAL